MSSNVVNTVPYINTTREFPPEIDQLVIEIDRGYVDIANAVNLRTIGLFPVNRGAITGEGWFLSQNQKQQTIRQVFIVSAGTPAITHNIQNFIPANATRCFGSYIDAAGNGYGLVFGTSTATPGLITFYLTNTQIIFVLGAGAPVLSSGRVIIEYLSAP